MYMSCFALLCLQFLKDVNVFATLPVEWLLFKEHGRDEPAVGEEEFGSLLYSEFEKRKNKISGVVIQSTAIADKETAQSVISKASGLVHSLSLPILLHSSTHKDVAKYSYKYLNSEKISFIDSEELTLMTNSGKALKFDEPCLFIDLNDPLYENDPYPIQKDCPCYACRRHRRSYIHHLLNTKEMLAQILISRYPDGQPT